MVLIKTKQQTGRKKMHFEVLPIYIPPKDLKITTSNFESFIKKYLINLSMADREYVVIVLMNSDHRYLGLDVVAVGSAIGTTVPLQNLLRKAIKMGATAAIIIHNHPSGCLRYSIQDERFARRMKRVLGYFDILLEATVIISNGKMSIHPRQGFDRALTGL